MVQEYVSPVRVHKYSFEMVMAAYERRFPNCVQIPVVIDCSITDDSWSADDALRHTTRRCQLNVEAPYLLKKMIGVDYIYFIQKNVLDMKSRVLEIEATNETFASRVGVIEKCRYYVHPENSEWTCFEQSAFLDVKNFFGLENTVEKIAMKQYAANIAKGKELIESFMKEVHADGVTELRPWTADDPEYNRELRRIVSRGTEPLSPRTNPEPKRHSQPGTSGSDVTPLSNEVLVRSKSETLTPSSPSTSHIPATPLSAGKVTNKRSSLLARKKSTERRDSSPKSKISLTKLLSKKNSKSKDLKEGQDEKEKMTASQPELKLTHDSFVPTKRDSKLSLIEKIKSCDCPEPAQETLPGMVGRWDSLMVVLVCVVAIMLTMTTPLSQWLARRRGS